MDLDTHTGISSSPDALALSLAIKGQARRQQTLRFTSGSSETKRKRSCSTGAAITGSCEQPHVCSPKKRRRHRPEVFEHVSAAATLQDGGAVYATCYPQTGLVYGEDRPQRRLPHHPSGSRTSLPVILPRTNRRVDAIPIITVRALHRSLCVLKGNKARCLILTPAGDLPDHLLGRSANSVPMQVTTVRGSLNSSLAVHSSGVLDKPAQEYNRTNPEHRVPRICNRFSSNDCYSSFPQGESDPEGGIPASDTGDGADQDFSTADWNIGGQPFH